MGSTSECHDLRPGLIDGGNLNASGIVTNVLSGNDPGEVSTRTSAGTAAGANKAIALKNSSSIVFRDFAIKNGGHFAIIGTGVVGWTVDGIIVDTNRERSISTAFKTSPFGTLSSIP